MSPFQRVPQVAKLMPTELGQVMSGSDLGLQGLKSPGPIQAALTRKVGPVGPDSQVSWRSQTSLLLM